MLVSIHGANERRHYSTSGNEITMSNSSEELVTFFKALADSNRLKIVGLLAEKPYSVEELAALLQLKPSTISFSCGKLLQYLSIG
jgi:predicted transcriptional regulator